MQDRRDAPPVALDRRPRPSRAGLGQRHRAPGLVDEDLAIGQPVRDRQGAVAEALGEHLAHGLVAGALRREQQRADERAQDRAARPERGDREHGDGHGEEAHQQPAAEAGLHRAEVDRIAHAREPADAEVEQAGRRADGDRRQHQHGQRHGQLDRAQREHARELPVGQHVEPGAGGPVARVAPERDGRDVGAEQGVGGAPVPADRPAAGGDRGAEHRHADPDDAERGPDRGDEHAGGRDEAQRHADQHVGQPAPRPAQPQRQVQPVVAMFAKRTRKGIGGADPMLAWPAHGPAARSMSPVPLSAWIRNGASSAGVRPRTATSPPSLSASIR